MNVFRRKSKVAVNAPNRKRESTAPSSPPIKARKKVRTKNKKISLKVLISAFRFLIVLIVIGLVLLGGIAAYGHATTTEYFALSHVDLTGGRRLSKAEIMKICEIEFGVNIFSVDTELLSTKLKDHPWILDAKAERKLPRTLILGITERRAEAMVLLDLPYIVDDSGNVFKRWVPGDPLPSPMITGITREQLTNDEEDVKATILNALALAERYRSSGLDRIASLEEIHREMDGGFSLTVGDDPFYIRLGVGPYRKKIIRLSDLLRRMKRDGKDPAIIFFDNEVRPERATVKIKH